MIVPTEQKIDYIFKKIILNKINAILFLQRNSSEK